MSIINISTHYAYQSWLLLPVRVVLASNISTPYTYQSWLLLPVRVILASLICRSHSGWQKSRTSFYSMVIILVINGWGIFEGCYLPKKLMN
jgi:hypothetical protein